MNRKINLAIVGVLASTLMLTGCTGDKSEDKSDPAKNAAVLPEEDRTEVVEQDIEVDPGEPVKQDKLTENQAKLYKDLSALLPAFKKAKALPSMAEFSASQLKADKGALANKSPKLAFLKGVKLTEGTSFAWEAGKNKLVKLTVTDGTDVLLHEESSVRNGNYVFMRVPPEDAAKSDFRNEVEAVFNAMDKYFTDNKLVPIIAIMEDKYLIQANMYGGVSEDPKVEVSHTDGVIVESFSTTEKDWSLTLSNPDTNEVAVVNSDNFQTYYLYPLS